MIISASYRTDIPAYHGDWFARMRAAGAVSVKNPYGGKPYRVSLRPEDVDGYVFWTRNAAPFLDQLESLTAPFVMQYTITGYAKDLEPAVPDWRRAVEVVTELQRKWGNRAAVWRYDPIALTDAMDAAFHRANFARLAAQLSSLVDEVTVSFMQPYAKSKRNLARAGIAWRDPPPDEKQALADDLAEIADAHGLGLTACTQPGLDLPPARCIDLDRLSAIAGRPIAGKTKGNRPGCLCAESRDIGWYDSCAQGCVYCYAVSSQARAAANLKKGSEGIMY